MVFFGSKRREKVLKLALRKIKIKGKIAADKINHKLACSGSMGSSSKYWPSCFQVFFQGLSAGS
jgi:hypothetical protein